MLRSEGGVECRRARLRLPELIRVRSVLKVAIEPPCRRTFRPYPAPHGCLPYNTLLYFGRLTSEDSTTTVAYLFPNSSVRPRAHGHILFRHISPSPIIAGNIFTESSPRVVEQGCDLGAPTAVVVCDELLPALHREIKHRLVQFTSVRPFVSLLAFHSLSVAPTGG